MAGPEVTRRASRVANQDETVRAISDTVVEIKETVDQHTETLHQHGEMLTEILRRLGNNTAD